MALRGPRPALCLLLALLAAGLAQFIPMDGYQTFLREHVDFPKTNATNAHRYCDLLMRSRGLTRPPCRSSNTFVHASPWQLQGVCTRGGICTRPRNDCDSRAAYLLTTCRLRYSLRPRRCVYQGRVQRRRIRLRCQGRLPVRFLRVL